jgi:hypothetical protein
MSKKDTQLIALKGYAPPAPPEPAPELKAADRDKVKARVRTLLGDSPMEHWKLVHLAKHHARVTDGISTITTPQVHDVIAEMATGDEFEKGYGKTVAQVEPEVIE